MIMVLHFHVSSGGCLAVVQLPITTQSPLGPRLLYKTISWVHFFNAEGRRRLYFILISNNFACSWPILISMLNEYNAHPLCLTH